MDELMSVTGKNMKIHPFISQEGVITDFFIFSCVISFSPFIYYASINVARERKRMKGLMTMMGLRNASFWWVKGSTNKCRNSGKVGFFKASVFKPSDFLTFPYEWNKLSLVYCLPGWGWGLLCFSNSKRALGLRLLGDCEARIMGDGHWVYPWVWEERYTLVSKPEVEFKPGWE